MIFLCGLWKILSSDFAKTIDSKAIYDFFIITSVCSCLVFIFLISFRNLSLDTQERHPAVLLNLVYRITSRHLSLCCSSGLSSCSPCKVQSSVLCSSLFPSLRTSHLNVWVFNLIDLWNQNALYVDRKFHSTLKSLIKLSKGAILAPEYSLWQLESPHPQCVCGSSGTSADAASGLQRPESSDLTETRVQLYGKENLPVYLSFRLQRAE